MLQPAVAVTLAIRAALRDARADRPPFLWTAITDARQRRAMLLGACSQANGDVIFMAGQFPVQFPRGRRTIINEEVLERIRAQTEATLMRMRITDDDRARIRSAWAPLLANAASPAQTVDNIAFELWRVCEPVAQR